MFEIVILLKYLTFVRYTSYLFSDGCIVTDTEFLNIVKYIVIYVKLMIILNILSSKIFLKQPNEYDH